MSEILISFHHAEDVELVDQTRLERLVQSVLKGESIRFAHVGVVLTRHVHLTKLNRDFLGHDYATDVLRFPLGENADGIEGEGYVDVETAQERHAEFSTTVSEEIERYGVHGVLHLCGYEDEAPEKKEHMRAAESRYLSMLE